MLGHEPLHQARDARLPAVQPGVDRGDGQSHVAAAAGALAGRPGRPGGEAGAVQLGTAGLGGGGEPSNAGRPGVLDW